MSARPTPNAERVLAEQVFAGGRSKPFAEMSVDEVKARAEELRAATGWGPTARIASIARAWGELGRLMDEQGALTVADLEPKAVAERAERLWVVPPFGG